MAGDGQRFDTDAYRAVRVLPVVNQAGFDPAIDRSPWDVSHRGGLFGCDHDGFARRAMAADRGQRAACRPNDEEFMDLYSFLVPARSSHNVPP
jgi:hypothetical protein